jgi:hypothetical protein
MTCERSAAADASQFVGGGVLEEMARQLGVGPLIAWGALMAMVGGAWATMVLGQRELRRGQRRTNARLRSVDHRVRRVEIRLGPGGDE